MKDQQCSNCRFYINTTCCYNPPTVFCFWRNPQFEGEVILGPEIQTVWPEPRGDSWCGKWESIEVKPDELKFMK